MRPPLAAVLLALCAPCFAAETAAFLDVGAGARALGLGGAYTALADEASAIYWNPAGLTRIEKREASLSHAELSAGTRHDFLAYAHPLGRATLGAAVTYLSHEAIAGRDNLGRPTGSYSASDAAMAFAVGVKTDIIDLGVSAKYLRSHLASAEAQGAALDVGVRREIARGNGKIMLGAALRNIGPGLKYVDQRSDLPLRASLGAAYRFSMGHSLAVDFQNGPRGAGSEGGLGGEYRALEGLFLRIGYSSKNAAAAGSGFSAARGLTLGFGLKRGGFGIDYAAQAAGELGNTHRVTLSSRF